MSDNPTNKDQDINQVIEEYLKGIFPERNALSLIHVDRMRLGASHAIFMLTVAWESTKGQISEDLVIRMEPDRGVHQSYDIGRECQAVKLMREAGVPVPMVYRLEEDKSVLGNPFIIMEKVEGVKLMEAWMRQPECRPQFINDFASILAKIHGPGSEDVDLTFLGGPDSGRQYVEQEIDKWERSTEDNQYTAHPVIAELGVWLRRNALPLQRKTVCHGDYSFLNAQATDGRIAAILDWEMVGLGDPISDIAWPCSMARTWHLPGWDEGSFIRSYEEAAGIRVSEERFRFWLVFSYFKMAAITVSGVRSYIEAKDASMRELFNFNMLLTVMQDAGAKLLGF